MSEPTVPLRHPLTAAFLAWLVPAWAICIRVEPEREFSTRFASSDFYPMGMVMGEGKIVYWRWVNPLNYPEKFCLYYVGQFFVGLPALPALIQGTLNHFGYSPIFGEFMAEPSQIVLNGLHPRLGKLVEMGTIYTTVAGLLNILAIYDAKEGPAYQEYDDETVLRSPSDTLTAAPSSIREARHDHLCDGLHLLADPPARDRDQHCLFRLPPRILASDLDALVPPQPVDRGQPGSCHGNLALDQYPGLAPYSTRRSSARIPLSLPPRIPPPTPSVNRMRSISRRRRTLSMPGWNAETDEFRSTRLRRTCRLPDTAYKWTSDHIACKFREPIWHCQIAR